MMIKTLNQFKCLICNQDFQFLGRKWSHYPKFCTLCYSFDWRTGKPHLRSRGFVYLVECQGFYKIGRSNYPIKRVENLDRLSAFRYDLLHTIPSNCTPRAEIYLHHEFKNYRFQSEWFKLPPHIVNFLCGIKFISEKDIVLKFANEIARKPIIPDMPARLIPSRDFDLGGLYAFQ